MAPCTAFPAGSTATATARRRDHAQPKYTAPHATVAASAAFADSTAITLATPTGGGATRSRVCVYAHKCGRAKTRAKTRASTSTSRNSNSTSSISVTTSGASGASGTIRRFWTSPSEIADSLS